MDKNTIITDSRIIWVLLATSILLIGLGYFSNNPAQEHSDIYKISGFTLYFSVWVILLFDIIKNKVRNKSFWVMSMFILATITPIVYLIRRNKVLKANITNEE